MAANIQKNEALNTARRCWLRVLLSDGLTPYWRGGSLVGRQYIGKSATSLVAAVGTVTNIRRPRTYTAFTFTATAATDLLTKTQHGFETGDGAENVSNSGGALPGGLVAATPYYAIKIDDDNFKLATSLTNAYLGVAIDITTNGTGTQTITPATGHERGMDGEFIYEYAQAETNVDGSELLAVAEDEKRVVTATAATDLINLTAHELVTGVAVLFSTSNTLPAPLATNTYYWAIRNDANSFKLATSFANALAGTAIDITTTGTGTHYLEPVIQRAMSTNGLERTGSSSWDYVIEGSHTAGDYLRGAIAILANVASGYNTGTIKFRDRANTKDRWTFTVDSTGRLTAVANDLT